MKKSYTTHPIDDVIYGLKPNNIAQFFDSVGADLMRQTNLGERTVRAMNKRMAQKSLCAMGGGMAIPNVKVRALHRPVTLLCVLDKAISCDTPDGQPLEMICIVLSPTHDGTLHLQRLSRFSRLLKDQDLRDKIRDAQDADIVRALLDAPNGFLIAA